MAVGGRRRPEPYVAPVYAPERPHRLKEADRCDRCGARAYVAAEIAAVDLLFCAHHFAASETEIRRVAAELLDERWQLVEQERRRHEF